MEKLGPIKAIIEDQTSPSDFLSNSNSNSYSNLENNSDSEPSTVILFHGFGADAYDLKSLSEVLSTKNPSRWVFPQGILEVPIGPGWTGRAWWPIDMVEWERAMMEGRPRDLVEWAPPELPSVRTKVFNMIECLKTPWNKIILGGFSQGAMLATDIFLSAPEKPQGLVLFSGALINKPDWKQKIVNRSGCTFFQCHGQNDAILSYKGAQQLEGFLTSCGMKGRLHTFSGGHEIPIEMIQKANDYLKTLGS